MAQTPKPWIIPVFIPHAGCPHRCVFCDQTAITRAPASPPSVPAVRTTIQRYLEYPRKAGRRVEIAFFGGNALGLSSPALEALMEEADRHVRQGPVDAIRFSTRPETVTPQNLLRIAPFGVKTVEIGAQSMNDRVLAAVHRGHTAEDTRRAVARLRRNGYNVGLQMMVGLPGQSPEDAMETGRRLADLNPDFVRIYPTVVFRNSPLARWVAEGRYRPLTLAEAVAQVKALYTLFRARGIAVSRMGIQGSDVLEQAGDILDGPYHPAFGHLVHAERFFDLAVAVLENTDAAGRGAATLTVHPANLSRLRGQKNENVHRLKKRFSLERLRVKTDASLPQDRVAATPD